MVVYIIAAVLIFGVLIAVHELGHFTAAKTLGVRVNEFAIGMGPAVFKRQKGETLYALRAFPIGGYCAMEGEDELSEDERSFTSAKMWKRLIILISGSLMNFILGFLIIVILFSSAKAFYTKTVSGFAEGSAVEQRSGLMAGDEILKIDGENIYVYSDIPTMLSRAGSDGVDIVFRRDGVEKSIIGANLTVSDMSEIKFGVEKATLGVKLKNSWYNAIDFVRLVRMSLMDLLRGAVGVKDLSGPIGIVDIMADVGAQAETRTMAVQNIAYLAAFIAVNLAVMNMLPIPALDGGRVFFVIVTTIIEKIRKKKIDPKYEGYIHTAGLVFFMGLMVFVAISDIFKIVSG